MVFQGKNRRFWTLGENWVKKNAESSLPIIGEGTIIASCESDLKYMTRGVFDGREKRKREFLVDGGHIYCQQT
ncbi:hypothetical protein K070079E91_19850 [Eisenbergiella porci]